MKNEYILKLTRECLDDMAQSYATDILDRSLTDDELDIVFKKVGNVLAEQLDSICCDVISDLDEEENNE